MPDAAASRGAAAVCALPRRVLIGCVRVYRLLLSPWLGSSCRFEPTCSAYAIEALERHGALCGSGAHRLAPAALPSLVHAAVSIPCPNRAPRLFSRLLSSLKTRLDSSHDRYPPHPAVGGVLDVAGPDVGRLEQAQRPARRCSAPARRPPRRRRPAAPPAAPAHAADARAARAGAPAHAPVPALPAAADRRAAAAAQRRPASRSRSRPTWSRPPSTAAAADLVRLELLEAGATHNDRAQQRVLFDQSAAAPVHGADRADPGRRPARALPNHLTPMKRGAGRAHAGRRAQRARGAASSRPTSTASSCARPTPSSAAATSSAVRHEVINNSAQAVDPQLYLQLVRDGNAPEGESSFYFTFTGPAIYTDANKFNKIDFKDIEKRGAPSTTTTQADNGWVAMVQHYFASAWLLGAGRRKRAREFYTAQGRRQPVLGRHDGAAGRAGAGCHQGAATPGCSPARRKKNKLGAMAPGLELVKDYGWLTILSKPLFWLLDQAARAPRQLGLVDRRAGGAAEGRVLLAQRQRLPLDGQDEGDRPEGDRDARAAEGQAAADAAGDDAHLPRGEGQPASAAACRSSRRCRSSSRCTGCCCRASRCATRRGSAGSTTCRPRTRTSSCRC